MFLYKSTAVWDTVMHKVHNLGVFDGLMQDQGGNESMDDRYAGALLSNSDLVLIFYKTPFFSA
jgi:hypothetical protein